MSLIQEALKRQAEEQPAVILPKLPIDPIAPPPDRKSRKARLIVPLILLLIVFLALPLGYNFFLAKPKHKSLPPAAQKAPAPAAESARPAADSKPVAAKEAPVPEANVAANISPESKSVTITVKKEEPVSETKQAWPELKLTGIAQGESQSIAILNGKMLTAGRTLGDVTVKEVHTADVVVEYRGERRVLYLNE
ncbi:MAG TPA: hypothetical protein PLD51_02595 [Pontiellaceae bacterium]|nr:hypothetical protein [Pontiellaceae bacterium]HPR82724.1 hypothetical protein [Pontiellaceae bacterium]